MQFCLVLFCSMVLALLLTPSARAKSEEASLSAKPYWIVNIAALQHMAAAGLPTELARYFFDNKKTFLTSTPKQTAFSSWNVTKVRTFTNLDSLQQAFANNKIGNDVEAILYDNEHWQFTPETEQQNVAEYTQRVAKLVHEHGLKLISTPATNLAAVLDPSARSGAKYDAFVRLGIAGKVAACSDVFEIQAQGSEMSIAKFSHFVHAASAQARKQNPGVVVLVGLSTGPLGQIVTAQQMFDAAVSVADCCDGFWLNVPGRSPYCPKCGVPRGDIAAQFLTMYAQWLKERK